MLENKKLQVTVQKTVSLPYVVYTPKNYDGSKKAPLLVFLHGAGERGTDLQAVSRYGFLKQAENGKDFPFIIAAPQCPQGQYWGNYLESLNIFLDELIKNYAVDENRIYLTGLSMGGTGTWLWLMANPERFAAAAPVCGSGVYWYACNVAHKPIWMFHGGRDTVVLLEESTNMYRNLIASGGKPNLTIYETVGHDAWNNAYSDELVEWLMKQTLN